MSFQKSGALSKGNTFALSLVDDQENQTDDPEAELVSQILLEQTLNIQIVQQLFVVAASQHNYSFKIFYNPAVGIS